MAKKKKGLDTSDNESLLDSNKKRKSAAKKIPGVNAPVTSPQAKEPKYAKDDLNRPLHRTMPVVLVALALFVALSFFLSEDKVGTLGKLLGSELLFGLFSWSAVTIPVFLFVLAIFWRRDVREHILGERIVFSAGVVVILSMLFHIPALRATWRATPGYSIGSFFGEFFPALARFYRDGKMQTGGGLIGGLLANLFGNVIGVWGMILLTAVIVTLYAIYFLGVTPVRLIGVIREAAARRREARAARALERERYEAEHAPVPLPAVPALPEEAENSNTNKEKASLDDYFDDDDDVLPADPAKAAPIPMKAKDRLERVTAEICDDVEEVDVLPEANPLNAAVSREPAPAPTHAAPVNADLHATITPDMVVVKNVVGENLGDEKKAPTRGYVYPSIELLDKPAAKADGNIDQEIQTNADILIQTLASFNVTTRITGISRGPRITRYELVPESGTRIRSISNLVDDISMNLASSGIRIEAPIPGKAAVGIEVPNRKPTNVSFRELVDSKDFRSGEKTTACLGADVAGTPVFCDIAKTPHMLVAGATGMGKSVCINTIICSLLYKATPDEVKLIMIDPKKVEFNVYRGIPHLLVPVVCDPKKAAGALAWAVGEMERRYDLIEEMGVRNIKGYNEAIKGTDREFLPKIIIIIDELADLMMTSPDTVEESIQRITQKARAAGIHLIIGTQRPTTDVVTGTIKANIPTRIAFHVASQIDSRTILDIVGAEKLLNNGDMLFNPVGASKPLRVQGAFIDDKEVERIATFLRETSGCEDSYSAGIMADIEREAERCSQSGKKSGGITMDEGDASDITSDPKLYEALEIAVETGKISTSLLQRKIKVGYGRAAKYIDYMEQMGYVSEPDGMKPRQTLISRNELEELLINRDKE